jgi:general secretion pathway protein M
MKFAQREKNLIAAAACIVMAALLFQLVVFPFIDNRRRMQRGIEAKTEALRTIATLSSEYTRLQEDAVGTKQRLAARQKNFTLFSYLEKAAGEAAVKKNIKYMKPSASTVRGPFKESLVEMKLEKVTLQQLTGYLQKIESPQDIVSIRRISIQSGKEEDGYLDAVLQVLTLDN